jgi:outer membrane protein OmpA-like peptidoglycan-associated protein
MVKDYLVESFSIPSSKVVTNGEGELNPIESNSTAEGRSQNRRVEIVFLKKINHSI